MQTHRHTHFAWHILFCLGNWNWKRDSTAIRSYRKWQQWKQKIDVIAFAFARTLNNNRCIDWCSGFRYSCRYSWMGIDGLTIDFCMMLFDSPLKCCTLSVEKLRRSWQRQCISFISWQEIQLIGSRDANSFQWNMFVFTHSERRNDNWMFPVYMEMQNENLYQKANNSL